MKERTTTTMIDARFNKMNAAPIKEDEMELYKVKYEGEAYIFAKSPEDAIKHYETEALRRFTRVTGTEQFVMPPTDTQPIE